MRDEDIESASVFAATPTLSAVQEESDTDDPAFDSDLQRLDFYTTVTRTSKFQSVKFNPTYEIVYNKATDDEWQPFMEKQWENVVRTVGDVRTKVYEFESKKGTSDIQYLQDGSCAVSRVPYPEYVKEEVSAILGDLLSEQKVLGNGGAEEVPIVFKTLALVYPKIESLAVGRIDVRNNQVSINEVFDVVFACMGYVTRTDSRGKALIAMNFMRIANTKKRVAQLPARTASENEDSYKKRWRRSVLEAQFQVAWNMAIAVKHAYHGQVASYAQSIRAEIPLLLRRFVAMCGDPVSLYTGLLDDREFNAPDGRSGSRDKYVEEMKTYLTQGDVSPLLAGTASAAHLRLANLYRHIRRLEDEKRLVLAYLVRAIMGPTESQSLVQDLKRHVGGMADLAIVGLVAEQADIPDASKRNAEKGKNTNAQRKRTAEDPYQDETSEDVSLLAI